MDSKHTNVHNKSGSRVRSTGMCGSTPPECDVGLQNVRLIIILFSVRKKMAERASDPTGIPSSGETTPEYNAVQKSYGDIEPAIICDPFVCRAGECGLLPTRNPLSPLLEVVLKEISRDPVNYYSFQYVVSTLNVGNRFNKGIGKMETTFQRKDIMHALNTNLKVMTHTTEANEGR